MSRCEYDVIFYRVFCLTLLAIAFTFTVILTNVFVDIDGLLYKKDAKTKIIPEEIEKIKVNIIPEETKADIIYEERNYEDDNMAYRTKRSLESPNFLFHIKNPTMKTLLTNQLATLLEELDDEETNKYNKEEMKISKEKSAVRLNSKDINKLAEIEDLEEKDIEKEELKKSNSIANPLNRKTEDNMLHLAMHNILLQGIIGHMDLGDVYKKINSLVTTFENSNKKQRQYNNLDKPVGNKANKEENKFFEEIVKCKDLQEEIKDHLTKETTESRKSMPVNVIGKSRPKILIKTVIDVISPKNNDTSSNEVKGVIKLIYNGKSIKFTSMESDETSTVKAPEKHTKETTTAISTTSNITNTDSEATPRNTNEVDETIDLNQEDNINIPKAYINKMIDEYLGKYTRVDGYSPMSYLTREKTKIYKNNRQKRHIKIKYSSDSTVKKNQSKENKTKTKDDDELYVEIETHFDSKGMKGEKKKKLIRDLIDKIQKAIHSKTDDQETNKTKKHKHVHVKKRIQNPLDNKKMEVIQKFQMSEDSFNHRQLHPIGKLPVEQRVPKIYDQSGETWKKRYNGPGFLAAAKSLNSAEMAEVDVDYNKVMNINGIPQRLQKPLNTDVTEEMLNTNYFNLGNLKFSIKEIDGAGFSIGFNQYTDEAPDPETIDLFTGVEHLVNAYQNNDQENTPATNINTPDTYPHSLENGFEPLENKYDGNQYKHDEHTAVRRSIQDQDVHSNEYKVVFGRSYLPYKSYDEIFKNKKTSLNINKDDTQNKIQSYNHNSNKIKIISDGKENEEVPLIVDGSIFDKNLNPSEIFSLVNLLDRRKRTINVKKFSNIRKMKVNKYLNTKSISKKMIILNKKRSKRQIDKIRIIATDTAPKPKQSEENIFIVSDEHLLADRAVIREIDTPEDLEIEDRIEKADINYNYVPKQYEYTPFHYNKENVQSDYIKHVFEERSRHNALMSKYPHIFMDEISKSKEDATYDSAVYSRYRDLIPQYQDLNIHDKLNGARKFLKNPDDDSLYKQVTTENYQSAVVDVPMQNLEGIVNAIAPEVPKTKYKLTVKIMPKNSTEVNSGFKEIHTSINKSFNKDGLLYSSLVNVSEISKIEKLNETLKKNTEIITTTTSTTTTESNLKQQKEKIKSMIIKHKNRIDEQLNHLRNEKEHLEKMVKNDSGANEFIDIEIPLNPRRRFHLKQDDVKKLAASALMNFQEKLNEKELKLSQTTLTSAPTITTSTTKTTETSTTEDPVKIRIINTIEKNDNLTKEILNKINKNIDILQKFLLKLTDTVLPVTENQIEGNNIKINNPVTQKEWKIHRPVQETIALQEQRNGTRYAIPFIYAYQQPYNLPYKAETPMASVVYHGHIHTNTIQKPREIKNGIINVSHNDVIINNGSRFFIDDLESDYKVSPANTQMKQQILTKHSVPTHSNITVN